jgi:hypothetical protein
MLVLWDSMAGWWFGNGWFFHSVGITTDEVHHFSEGELYHQPVFFWGLTIEVLGYRILTHTRMTETLGTLGNSRYFTGETRM